MREVPTISEKQMPEWREICKAYAERIGAKLLFVNNTSCGVEYSDGTFTHVTIEGMREHLERLN